MFKAALFVVISLLIAKPTFGQSNEIVASFGGTLPPYVLQEGQSGVLVDLLRDCLEPAGYSVTSKLLPYSRRLFEFQTNQVNVVSDINQKVINDTGLKGYYTGDIYAYENFFYSLSERDITITKIEEISEYSLLSWQGAIAHIGGDYAAMAKQNKNYSETHNQKTQLRMLFNKRVDFIQMDGNIYEFFRQEILQSNEVDVTIPVKKLPLLGKSPNGFLFKSEAARDACVTNIALLKENKKYKDVLYFGEDLKSH